MSLKTRRNQVIIAIGLFISVEVILRTLVDPPADYYHFYRTHGADGHQMLEKMGSSTQLLAGANKLLKIDKDLLWTIKPNLTIDAESLSFSGSDPWSITTNSDGFRDREGEKSTWLALGDSCTFGWGSKKNWTDILEVSIDQPIQNISVPGYSSAQGKSLLEQRGESKIDIMTLNFGANDGHMVFEGDHKKINQRQTIVGQFRYWLASLHVVQHARSWLYSFWADGTVVAWKAGVYQPRVTPEEFLQNHEFMIQKAKKTILLDICIREEYSIILQDLAQKYEHVDLIKYKDLNEQTVDGCHPTIQGHHALANSIAKLIDTSSVAP